MPTKEGFNDTNNNTNSSNNNFKSKMSVRQIVSEVSQLLSMCSQDVNEKKADELNECLPQLDVILSEISNLVMICQEHKEKQKVTDDELVWDYSQDMVVYPEMSSTSSLSCSVLSLDISSDSNSSYSDPEGEERQLAQEIFVDGMVEAIDRIAPGSVFNARKSERKRRRKIMTTFVPRMFRSVWKYYDTILTPAPAPKPRIINPTIDWSKVNRRFLDNLPKEGKHPVHGCSEDPEFYKESLMRLPCGREEMLSKHSYEPYPFGSDYGYMTQYGVISRKNSVGDLNVPVNGYINTGGHWVLHAEYPDKTRDKESRAKRDRAKQNYIRGGPSFRSRESQRRASR